MSKSRQIRFVLIRSLVAISIALLVATLLIFISADGNLLGEKLEATREALKQLLAGPVFRFSKKNGTAFEAKRLADILAAMIPTTFTGLSVCIMFSANQFNLGAEGGIMLGAFLASMVAIYLPLPAGLHAVVSVLIAGVAVALVMLIPALLKIRLQVSEMVCSLMMNYIIMYVIKFLMNTYLADKSRGQIQSYAFRETALIPPIVNNTVFSGAKLSWGFVVALVSVVLCWLFLYRSPWGYTIRMIGINQDFSLYSGMKVGAAIVFSQVLGGLLAGAGGGIEILGRYTSFSWSALPGYGWTGITIAILAGNNPAMVPLAAFFMAYLSKGCDLMATYAKVPSQLISIIQGVIFLFFAAEQFLSGYRQKLVIRTAQEEMERERRKEGERT